MSIDLQQHLDYLPNLPGSRPRVPAVPRTKKSYFTKNGDVRFVAEEPEFHAPDLVKQNNATSLNLGALPLTKQRFKPSRMICNFTGYYKEGVYDSRDEHCRVHICQLNYYIEDDTLEVTEPRQENAAIPQGKFLRRHKVPKVAGEGNYYTLQDFDVGAEITLYGRTFLIIDANGSTRKYLLNVHGRELGCPLQAPKDEYTEKKKVQMSRETGRDPAVSHHIMKNPMTSFAEAKLGKMIDHSARAGFLKYSRACLGFDCVWDDREKLYGDLLGFRVHYFLADDSLEVVAVHTRNDGRDGGRLLVKRGKVMKDETNPYHWEDFYIGAEITIYKRKLFVIDADPYTRRFFDKQSQPLGPRILLPDEELPRYQREIPPHTGYGSEEDSLTSCPGHSLVISRPRIVRDVREDRNLSYKALLVSDRPEDEGREFTITYFTLDNTICIYEPPKRNSGIVGGKFLARREVKDINNENMPRDHFFVGNTVNLYAHEFMIVSADEPTMRYMERNRDKFPHSYIRGVMDIYAGRLREHASNGKLQEVFQNYDIKQDGKVNIQGLRSVLKDLQATAEFGGQPEQAIITVMRYMAVNGWLEYSRFMDFILDPEEKKLYVNTAEK